MVIGLVGSILNTDSCTKRWKAAFSSPSWGTTEKSLNFGNQTGEAIAVPVWIETHYEWDGSEERPLIFQGLS